MFAHYDQVANVAMEVCERVGAPEGHIIAVGYIALAMANPLRDVRLHGVHLAGRDAVGQT